MRITVGILTAAIVSLALGVAAAAGPKPGEEISQVNSQSVRELVSPGVYYLLQHGLRMKIVAPTTIQLPPPYKDATEKYSAQVRLSKDQSYPVGICGGTAVPAARSERS